MPSINFFHHFTTTDFYVGLSGQSNCEGEPEISSHKSTGSAWKRRKIHPCFFAVQHHWGVVGKKQTQASDGCSDNVGFLCVCFKLKCLAHVRRMCFGHLFWGERYKTLVVLYWETYVFSGSGPLDFRLGGFLCIGTKMLLASRLEAGIIRYAQKRYSMSIIECHSSMSPTIPFFKTSRCRDQANLCRVPTKETRPNILSIEFWNLTWRFSCFWSCWFALGRGMCFIYWGWCYYIICIICP